MALSLSTHPSAEPCHHPLQPQSTNHHLSSGPGCDKAGSRSTPKGCPPRGNQPRPWLQNAADPYSPMILRARHRRPSFLLVPVVDGNALTFTVTTAASVSHLCHVSLRGLALMTCGKPGRPWFLPFSSRRRLPCAICFRLLQVPRSCPPGYVSPSWSGSAAPA